MPQLKPLKLVLAGVDKISAPVTRITRRLDQLNQPVKRLSTSFRNLGKSAGIGKLGGALKGVGKELGKLTRKAGLFVAAMAAAGYGALRAFVSTADEIGKTADFAGIGVEALQEYRFAFDRAGVSQEKVDKGLIKLGKTIGELRAGTGTLLTILKKTNPQFAAQLAHTSDSEEAFDLLIKKLAETENQMDRAALANAAFGRTGQLLVNAVKDGLPEFERMRKRARELGLVLNEDAVRAGEEASDIFTDIRFSVRGLALSIGSTLLPEIIAVSNQILAWIQANRELIKTKGEEFVRKLAGAFRQLIETSREWYPIASRIVEIVGGLTGLVKILALAITAKLIVALYALSATLLTTPIGWFILAVTALVAAGYGLYKAWAPIKEFFAGLWDGAVAGVRRFLDALPDFIATKFGFSASQPFVGGRGGSSILGARPPNAAAMLAPGGASTFDGKLAISIAQDRPPRVEQFDGASTDFDVDIETGMTLAPAGF